MYLITINHIVNNNDSKTILVEKMTAFEFVDLSSSQLTKKI